MALGEVLVQKGLITPQALEQALAEQRKTGDFLGAILARQGSVSEEKLLPVLAEKLKVPYVLLRDQVIPAETLAKVPAKFASHYHLIPLRFFDNALEVATANPFDVHTFDELKLLLNCEIKPVLAGAKDIKEAIQRHYGVGARTIEQLLDSGARATTAAVSTAEDLTAAVDEASIVAFVNQLIRQSVSDRATDIHIEPYETTMRIRERIDGVLYELPIPPDLVKLHQAVISRIKVMAQLDIAEKRLPQDGRIKVKISDDALDLRVSVLPTTFGEAVDIRILSSSMLYSLEQLGLAADYLDILEELIQKPHGIMFVTGPTGSGKTTTLYACLSKLNKTQHKIITIEDPVEYQIPGITQIQVHPKIGLTFAQGLRSMLRHDPDIMMVGEVRDPETAEITIRSSLTGHLVFSTLHTNDAAGGVTRLLDMGIEPFLVASSVLCFIAQRLVRTVCPQCAEDVPCAPILKEQFGVTELPKTYKRGRGCPACKGIGFRGRTAIYEFLSLNDSVRKLILKRSSSQEILEAAKANGMRTLRQDGWARIALGHTTPEEVLRVT